MKSFLNRLTYYDLIFYFLTCALFVTFLMPFMHYTTLNLVKVSSGGQIKLYNNLLPENLYLFIYRYSIFYYSLCIACIAFISNRKLLLDLMSYFLNLSKLLKISICLFFIFGIISSCFAISPSIAFKGVSVTFLQFVCVLFIAKYTRDNHESIKKFYIVILLSLIFFGASLFLQLILANYSIYGAVIAGNIQEVLAYMYNCLNPRFLDNYFSWFVPLLLLPWFANLRPILKLGSFIALSMVWFVLINHAFRTIFAEYLIILPLLFLYSRKFFKVAVTILCVTLLCGFLLDAIYTQFIMANPNGDIGSPIDLIRMGDSGRSLIWKEAFWVGIEHPFTGIGQWNYIAVTKYKAGYPHNLLLEIWSQWGIPAFIAAALVILTSVKNLFKKRAVICANPYYCIFIMMLAAGMIDGMLNAMFKTSLGLFGCVFVFGFCLSIFAEKDKAISKINLTVSSSILILAILVSIFCIVILPLIFPPMWI